LFQSCHSCFSGLGKIEERIEFRYEIQKRGVSGQRLLFFVFHT
jgi:hypothetical protein